MSMELVKNCDTKEPARDKCTQVVDYCLRNMHVMPSAGVYGNVLRMLLSLAINDAHLSKGLDVLESAFCEVSTGLKN